MRSHRFHWRSTILPIATQLRHFVCALLDLVGDLKVSGFEGQTPSPLRGRRLAGSLAAVGFRI